MEIILHDDASTDQTVSIIEEYRRKYPDKIIPLYQTENQYSKGIRGMMPRFNFPRAHGKYLALCEGDDFWTDPHKLQTQVDFLEQHSEYALCAHRTEERNELTKQSVLIPSEKELGDKSLIEYIAANYTATSSLLLRKEDFGEMPSWFPKVPFGDWAIVLIILERTKKKLKILPNVMSVYRVNEGGIHGSLKKNNAALSKAWLKHLEFMNQMEQVMFNKPEYKKAILSKRIRVYETLGRLKQEDGSSALNVYSLYSKWLKIKRRLFAS